MTGVYFMKNPRKKRFTVVLFMCIITFLIGAVSASMSSAPEEESSEPAPVLLAGAANAEASANEFVVVGGENGDQQYNFDKEGSAQAYIDNYAENVVALEVAFKELNREIDSLTSCHQVFLGYWESVCYWHISFFLSFISNLSYQSSISRVMRARISMPFSICSFVGVE